MPSNVSSLESLIQKLDDDLMEATRSLNLTFLENIFSEKYVCLASDGSIWGKEKALNDFKNPSFKLFKSDVQNRQITMHHDTAIITGIGIFEGIIDDKSISGQSFFMRVWHKEEDIWIIMAVHASRAN